MRFNTGKASFFSKYEEEKGRRGRASSPSPTNPSATAESQEEQPQQNTDQRSASTAQPQQHGRPSSGASSLCSSSFDLTSEGDAKMAADAFLRLFHRMPSSHTSNSNNSRQIFCRVRAQSTGFPSDECRRLCWPAMLIPDHYVPRAKKLEKQTTAKRGGTKGKQVQRLEEEENADAPSCTSLRAPPIAHPLPPSAHENILSQDLARCLWHAVDDPHDADAEELTQLRERLRRVVLRSISYDPSISYYQGLHELLGTVLLCVGDEEEAAAIAHMIADQKLRRFCNDSITETEAMLFAMHQVLRAARPELAGVLEATGVAPTSHYALSWCITWFAHLVDDPQTIGRLFDFLIACDEFMVLFVCCSLVIENEAFILDKLYLADSEQEYIEHLVYNQAIDEGEDIDAAVLGYTLGEDGSVVTAFPAAFALMSHLPRPLHPKHERCSRQRKDGSQQEQSQRSTAASSQRHGGSPFLHDIDNPSPQMSLLTNKHRTSMRHAAAAAPTSSSSSSRSTDSPLRHSSHTHHPQQLQQAVLDLETVNRIAQRAIALEREHSKLFHRARFRYMTSPRDHQLRAAEHINDTVLHPATGSGSAGSGSFSSSYNGSFGAGFGSKHQHQQQQQQQAQGADAVQMQAASPVSGALRFSAKVGAALFTLGAMAYVRSSSSLGSGGLGK